MAPRHRQALIAATIGLVVVGVDQASKAWARQVLRPGEQVTVIAGWLWFRLTSNSGATLGILQGYNLLILGVSMLLVGAIVVVLLRGGAPGQLGAAALGAVAGGAASNLVDRVRLGGVTDFIEVHLWPSDFNLADAGIRLGVVLFLLALLLGLRRPPRGDDISRHPA